MAGAVDDLPAPRRCMMLMAPLSVTVPCTKSSMTVKWLCSCSVKPVTLLTSLETWWTMCSMRPHRLAVGVAPHLPADLEEVDEVVVERPRRIELRAVDRVLEVLERVPLRSGTGRR